MIKTIITLGDSWPEGAELGNGLRYGDILKDVLNYEDFINFGSAGASNEDMFEQLQTYGHKYHTNRNTTAIFFLTNPHRSWHWPRFFDWGYDGSWQDKYKECYLYFHSDQHTIRRNSMTVIALQSLCKQWQINDYYFAGWVRYAQWSPGVDLSKIYAEGNQTAADWFNAYSSNSEHLTDVENNPYIKPNFAHPNQLGHQLIADKLAAWIQDPAQLK